MSEHQREKYHSHEHDKGFKATLTMLIEAEVPVGDNVWSNIIVHDDCMSFFSKYCSATCPKDLDEEFLMAARFFQRHYGISVGGWQHGGKMRRMHSDCPVELRSFYICPIANWHIECSNLATLGKGKIMTGGFHLHFLQDTPVGGHYGHQHGGRAHVKAGSTLIWGYHVLRDRDGQVVTMHVASLVPECLNKDGYVCVSRRLYNSKLGYGMAEGTMWYKCKHERVHLSGRLVGTFPGRRSSCIEQYVIDEEEYHDKHHRGYSKRERMGY